MYRGAELPRFVLLKHPGDDPFCSPSISIGIVLDLTGGVLDWIGQK